MSIVYFWLDLQKQEDSDEGSALALPYPLHLLEASKGPEKSLTSVSLVLNLGFITLAPLVPISSCALLPLKLSES